MRARIVAAFVAAGFLAAASVAAQEHPKEHPKGSEHPKQDKAQGEMTMEELAQGIEAYIDRDAELKGGYFLVYDKVDKKPLLLTLVKIHEDKLASLGNGVYFACTDLKNTDGVVYDLDFLMVRDDEGDVEETEVSIHKKADVARYGWKEEKGVWKKVQP